MYYVIAFITALLLSAFQYLYKRKVYELFILRFLVYFLFFVLLINPKITHQKKEVTRPTLYVLSDNSSSIKKQNQDSILIDLLKQLKKSLLKDKFELQFFKFDREIIPSDSLDFRGKKTNLSEALEALKFLYMRRQPVAVVLLTDGQANTGKNYRYSLQNNTALRVFPVVLGDTTHYEDLKIDLLNHNPYVYKNNRFPVEIFISAQIEKQVEAYLKIYERNKVLFEKKIKLSPDQKSVKIQAELKANQTGTHHYTARITGLPQEKNHLNNTKYFSVEVIDNMRKVLLISSLIHPDLGAIRRSLESDPYIKLTLKKPDEKIDYVQYQSILLYQPKQNFESVFSQIKKLKKPWMVISGTKTDWDFLNKQKLFFSKLKVGINKEQFFSYKNNAFSLFHLPDLQLDNYPPLEDFFGNINFNESVEIAYYSQIQSIKTQQPLLAFNTLKREGVLLGENLWQWRMQAGLNDEIDSFEQLWKQVIRYLEQNPEKKSLRLEYEKQFFQGDDISIIAHFLNKNLEPDTKVQAFLHLNNREKTPMFLENNYYRVNLNQLVPGDYTFMVSNKDGSIKKYGKFSVLPFDLEDKNLQANLNDLQGLANNTQGKLYFPSQIKQLIDHLLNDKQFYSVANYKTTQTDLIDYRYILGLIVLLLSIEWFLKKLRGEL